MKKILLAAVASVLAVTPAMASTDGTLGTTSTGTLDVTATIAPMVRVSGLNDLNLVMTAASFGGSGTWAAIELDNFCVYSNVTGAGNYNIRVDGAPGTASQRYGLAGPESSTLNYAVHVGGVASTNPNASLIWSGQTRAQTTASPGVARATDINCNNVGGTNAMISARVSKVDGLAAIAGTYTGQLSVVVSVP